MPLHDWAEQGGWEGFHLLWMGELLRHVKGQLPAGYRAYLGSGPAVAIGSPAGKPDVAVRSHAGTEVKAELAGVAAEAPTTGAALAPDVEVAVALLDASPALFVERDGRLVSAVELVSPRNKDRPAARIAYLSRYAGYLIGGVHLLLVDVHRRPAGFSFADQIGAELQLTHQPPLPPPLAASYRVGEPAAAGGRFLAIWRRPMTPGDALPTLPLPLTTEAAVAVDLEATYSRAAADAYL